ncbi:MAG TPA: DNA repair protein RadA, partial [Microbacterium sp.]|nr:DNA repair protein RadA [Microbacterium sp.]
MATTRRPAPPAFTCTECGWTTAKWVGRCGECQQWGTVQEQAVKTGIFRQTDAVAPLASRAARPITQITTADAPRRTSGVGEFD